MSHLRHVEFAVPSISCSFCCFSFWYLFAPLYVFEFHCFLKSYVIGTFVLRSFAFELTTIWTKLEHPFLRDLMKGFTWLCVCHSHVWTVFETSAVWSMPRISRMLRIKHVFICRRKLWWLSQNSHFGIESAPLIACRLLALVILISCESIKINKVSIAPVQE